MKRSKKVLITAACLFLVLLVSSSIYVFNRLEHIMNATSMQQLLESNSNDKLSTFSNPKASENHSDIDNSQTTDSSNNTTEASSQSNSTVSQADAANNDLAQADAEQAKAPHTSAPAPSDKSIINDKIASTLEKEAGKPVDTSDMLKAGFILMSKLNNEEINFLFGFSDKKYSKEDLIELRKLLLSKLSAEDVQTLRSLADKYGKNLYILDPSVPIK